MWQYQTPLYTHNFILNLKIFSYHIWRVIEGARKIYHISIFHDFNYVHVAVAGGH